jgi:hypothetical protein
MSPGPLVGTPLSVHAPLEPIKGRARRLEHKLSGFRAHKLFYIPPTHKFHRLANNTAHSGRKVLRSSGLNHSKPLCAFRVHTPLDLAFLDFPKLILN